MPKLLARICPPALLAFFFLTAPAQAERAAALPPPAAFFENPTLSQARLSPSGKFLAARSGAPGRRDYLVVVELETRTAKLVAGYGDADIRSFQWVNDERLVFDVTDRLAAPGERRYAPGLYGVNRDGAKLVQLVERRSDLYNRETGSNFEKRILPWHTFMLDQAGAEDSEHIYVESLELDSHWTVLHTHLLRLNTVTGRTQRVPAPGKVDQWLLDNKGEPRLAIGSERGTTTIHYRDPATGTWRVVSQQQTYGGSGSAVSPVGFGADGVLYVTAAGGQDTSALHTFNFATGKINPEPVLVTRGYDFDGELVRNRAKLLGVRLRTDAESNVWFDPAMQTLQQRLDKLLPGTANLISVASGANVPWVLVESYSDARPPVLYLFDTKTDALSKVGDTRPGIDPAAMGRQQPVRYKARDGLDIPGLLTLPPGGKGKNLPLVVLVHGGPYVRGATWGWDPQTQFLASRGYAVLQPEFRGSTGFGWAHFRAGWKQWGLAMQDDIADGVRWAIAQGIADPKRVCIAGASYGGYAALMGLAKDQDLYRCAISWAGVTDIKLLYDGHWRFDSDLPEQWKRYGMPELVGDPVHDAAQLKATSPIFQVERIRHPLLLAYGSHDLRVPLVQGQRFRDALKATNQQVEWIEYLNEGHGWSLVENRIDFWGRVEKFLDQHIGKGAAN
ncbi:alpha/beta hydrolase family protein [Massilia sp. SYSU DXS3249]